MLPRTRLLSTLRTPSSSAFPALPPACLSPLLAFPSFSHHAPCCGRTRLTKAFQEWCLHGLALGPCNAFTAQHYRVRWRDAACLPVGARGGRFGRAAESGWGGIGPEKQILVAKRGGSQEGSERLCRCACIAGVDDVALCEARDGGGSLALVWVVQRWGRRQAQWRGSCLQAAGRGLEWR